MITFFSVPGQPTGKGRPRVNTITHRAYTPQKTRAYESLVQESYKYAALHQKRHSGPVRAEITAFYKIPKTWPSSRKRAAVAGEISPLIKPDLDNVAKAVLDALNGLAYTDDSSITELIVRKVYADEGRVEVTLRSGGDLP